MLCDNVEGLDEAERWEGGLGGRDICIPMAD